MAGKEVLRPLDADAVRQARTLLRHARHGALAVLDPASGAPLASRVAVSTDCDGAPVILISALAAHTGALRADPRCSLLVGMVGKGDALAHPRLSISCRAAELEPGAPATERVAARFLRHVPKAALYAGLPDFRYFRLEPEGTSFNGGFAKAYHLKREDLLAPDAFVLAESETGMIEHMNADHADAVALYAERLGGAESGGNWIMTGIDPEGIDLASGDRVLRIWFDERVETPSAARGSLVALAKAARASQG